MQVQFQILDSQYGLWGQFVESRYQISLPPEACALVALEISFLKEHFHQVTVLYYIPAVYQFWV